MKVISRHIIMLVAICASVISCSFENEFDINAPKGEVIRATAAVAEFANVKIGTKATESEESHISNLTMIIFDSKGQIVGEPISNNNGNLVFLIDPKADEPYILNGEGKVVPITNSKADLTACTMYMVANCADEVSDVGSEQELLATQLDVKGIEIPEKGFPMIGREKGINLSGNGTNTMVNVTMKKLYSKINVRFQINANQVIKTPKFNLKHWSVENVPAYVRLGVPESNDLELSEKTICAEDAENSTSDNTFTTSTSNTLSYGYSTISHSESMDNPEYFQFTFYAPEHKVIPDFNRNSYEGYPEHLPKGEDNTLDERQRYKPLLCSSSKNPMVVVVEGSYTDHHGQVKEVKYRLYLGQNEIDDFFINRNQQIDNVITIKGLTNSKDAADWPSVDPSLGDNISVDHRVEITDTGFSIALEREALLDSHFEVRPMKVFVEDGAKVRVTVDENSNTDPKKTVWLRIENSYGGNADNNKEGTKYIPGVGVRKYFTTNLIDELKASTTIDLTSDSTIWLYFDENTNRYDKTLDTDPLSPLPKSREINLVVEYFEKASDSKPKVTHNYTFQQMHLWRVRNADNTRYYDIEYHEEYLYNYVSNDNYGKTTDGMAWGLDGVQLSENDNAIYIQGTLWDGLVNANLNPKYDFYLPRDVATTALTTHQYDGLAFSNKIISKNGLDGSVVNLELNDDPNSAVQYCYNKNKRNDNGGISITKSTSNGKNYYTSTEVKWFLPSIDQIEEIVVSAYQDFEVFQEKWYWSSQPAYTIYDIYYEGVSKQNGHFYQDNKSNARATKVEYSDGWGYVTSGDGLAKEKYNFYLNWIFNADYEGPLSTGVTDEQVLAARGLGNKHRDEICRVRCVFESGFVSELTSSTN